MIDLEVVRRALRVIMWDAEVVQKTATGELIGIRDGEYNAAIHTRPDSPAIRRILTASETALEDTPFDPNGVALYYEENLLPAVDFFPSANVELFTGIYQLTVWALKGSSDSEPASQTCNRQAKYLCEIFSIKKDPITPTAQPDIQEVVVSSVNRNMVIIPDSKYYGIAVSLNLKVYWKEST